MRHNRGTFFNELTPLANAIRRVCPDTPMPQLSLRERAAVGHREEEAARAKRAAKLARRAARAGHKATP